MARTFVAAHSGQVQRTRPESRFITQVSRIAALTSSDPRAVAATMPQSWQITSSIRLFDHQRDSIAIWVALANERCLSQRMWRQFL